MRYINRCGIVRYVGKQHILNITLGMQVIYVGNGTYRFKSVRTANFLIVKKAEGVVQRGWRPFIFGRRREEINFAPVEQESRKQRCTEFQVFKKKKRLLGGGYSSRWLPWFADGFWVITGHKSYGSLSRLAVLISQIHYGIGFNGHEPGVPNHNWRTREIRPQQS
jgi:hypothetical protein